jgi:alpha-galactosidase
MRRFLSRCIPAGILLISILYTGCEKAILIEGEEIAIEFNQKLYSRIISNIDGEDKILSEFGASEYLKAGANLWTIFPFKSVSVNDIEDHIGVGNKYTIVGESDLFKKTISAIVYKKYPRMVFYQVNYINLGGDTLNIEQWTNNRYLISSDPAQKRKEFKSFQTGIESDYQDWIIPVKQGFRQQNVIGLNNSAYGDTLPIIDVWRKDIGLAVGHVEIESIPFSMPVEMADKRGAFLMVTHNRNEELKPGEDFDTFQTFVSVHKGDCSETINEFKKFMMAKMSEE